jgi:MFS family permease
MLSMKWGLGLFVICVPPLFLLPGIWWAIPFCFFFHMANALFYPSLQIWMTECFGRKALQKVMGTYCVAWTSGFIVGPLLAGYVGQQWVKLNFGPEYHGPYLVSLIVIIGVFIAIWFHYEHRIPDESTIKSNGDFSNFKTEEFKNHMVLGWMTNTLGTFCAGVIRFLIPLLLVFGSKGELVPISMEQSSYLVPCLAFSLLLMVLVMRYTSNWILNFRFILLMEFLVVPASLVFLLSHRFELYFIPVFIFGMVNAFGFYTGAVYSLQLGEKGLKYITINEFLVGVGAFLGSLTGGVIAYFQDSKWAFASPILMLILMVVIQLRLKKKMNIK